jgi:chlorite dismutase
MADGEPERPAHGGADEPRVFVKYTFYKVRPEWRLLPPERKKQQKAEFSALVHDLEDEVVLRTYSLVGIRADADLMFWTVDPHLEAFRDLARRIASTELGHYLETSYSYLAATRPSEYFGGSTAGSEERAATKALPKGSRYLFVYPFWKKREWYSIPFEKRQEIMKDHFRLGHKFPSVKIHTAYSFGLDDQEFMLSFETDEPLDFLDLITALRPSEASKYTEWETPIFTCLLSTPEQMLDALGI